MKLDRARPKRELINITPLIDVVFILLVFFMLAGAIEPEDPFAVAPPASVSEERGDIQDFVVLVSENGEVALDDRPLERDELTGAVRAALEAQPGALIQLKPDGGADALTIIEIMEEIREAGAEYIVLLTVGRGEIGGGG